MVGESVDALLGLFGQRGQPDKGGIGKLVEMLQSSGGQQFWAAVPYFNVKCDKDRTPEDSERHLENMQSFPGDNVDELHELVVMLAEASARLYLFAIWSVEITSLLSRTDDWADKIAKQGHPPEVSQWKRRLDDPEPSKGLSSEWPEAEAARVLKVAESNAKKSSTHERPSLEDLKNSFDLCQSQGWRFFRSTKTQTNETK